MLNKRGGVEADLTVSRLEPGPAHLPLAPQSDGEERPRSSPPARFLSVSASCPSPLPVSPPPPTHSSLSTFHSFLLPFCLYFLSVSTSCLFPLPFPLCFLYIFVCLSLLCLYFLSLSTSYLPPLPVSPNFLSVSTSCLSFTPSLNVPLCQWVFFLNCWNLRLKSAGENPARCQWSFAAFSAASLQRSQMVRGRESDPRGSGGEEAELIFSPSQLKINR